MHPSACLTERAAILKPCDPLDFWCADSTQSGVLASFGAQLFFLRLGLYWQGYVHCSSNFSVIVGCSRMSNWYAVEP
jgi:hypothetical protein